MSLVVTLYFNVYFLRLDSWVDLEGVLHHVDFVWHFEFVFLMHMQSNCQPITLLTFSYKILLHYMIFFINL